MSYNRVVPWIFYGKVEDVPKKAKNWEQIATGQHGMQKRKSKRWVFGFQTKFPDQPGKFMAIDRVGREGYKMTKELPNGVKTELFFKLNTPGEVAFPRGKTLKVQ